MDYEGIYYSVNESEEESIEITTMNEMTESAEIINENVEATVDESSETTLNN
ncbi:37175_t:CDS:2, partial [Gigaspora margarita]